MVGPVHPQNGVRDQRALGIPKGLDLGHQFRSLLRKAGTVAVPVGQVLRPDGGPIQALPIERRGLHGKRNTPPHHRVGKAETPQDLGHLGHVAEHVRQVPNVHGPAELGGLAQPQLNIPDERLARHQEFVGQRVPRAHGELAFCRQVRQALSLVRPDLQIVVDHRHLAVELEVGVAPIRGQLGEQAVEQFHQLHPEKRVRLVPLPVPVGVWNDMHAAGHGHNVGRVGAVNRPNESWGSPRCRSAGCWQ